MPGSGITATSHLLQVLKQARLVTFRKAGRYVYYSATDMALSLWNSLSELASRESAVVKCAVEELFGGDELEAEALADKVVDAVKSGAIRKFVVMGGCDGRQKSREYFTDLAKDLPGDTVIMTAGCAKYRYNKLDLGDIGGIPRVLDDINDLPVDFAVAWYEQKAVCVLLALLALGFKGVRVREDRGRVDALEERSPERTDRNQPAQVQEAIRLC